METEKKYRPRRERKGSRRSSQPQQFSETMAVNEPAAIVPPQDTKAAIARSKSRYKGSRPKPLRSTSTPSVPAIAPPKSDVLSAAEKRSKRPTTTFDDRRNIPAATDDEDDDDNDDEPLIKIVQGRLAAAQIQISEPYGQALPMYNVPEPVNASPIKPDLAVLQGDRRSTDPYPHHSQSQSRAHRSRPQHTSVDDVGRRGDILDNDEDRRRIMPPTRPVMTPKKSFTQRIAGLASQAPSTAQAKDQLKQMISHPIPIEDPSSVAVAQFDAPKSAVNAGERTVKVKYNEFLVPISVIPSTTPADVIRSVSQKIVSPVDPSSSVMLESFKQLGLERPLRRYEHIRDVLNSWDSDSQNNLIIEPSGAEDHDDDLDFRHVPRKQPGDSTFYLYHSQRPCSWDKREVTLRSDGQMLVAKSGGAEGMNICHLSDFDIYIPTARQIAKKIQPPRRICFAVKSQQKSNMFLSTVNFVHFFSSNDRKITKAFYTAVQEWRSWYLVNIMGKGADTSSRSINSGCNQAMRRNLNSSSLNDPKQQSQRLPKTSTSQVHPTPSPDISHTSARYKAQDPVPYTSTATRQDIAPREHRDHQAPPIVIPRSSVLGSSAETPFADGGLLGRNYTHRKKAQQDHETQQSDLPIPGPALVPPATKPLVNELKRSSSQLKKPKPLVDLTPQYQEPPQHTRKGKGVTPGQIPAGGLIDIATSPEVAIPIPPTTSWRRPGTSSGPETSPPRNRPHL
ncbi:MAG: hypothetical protein L6R41_005136 [Letrouitia leprolyta]|nr:MAG: hypothetical protein L6R41_005136 [Letrouitia leprolyta]